MRHGWLGLFLTIGVLALPAAASANSAGELDPSFGTDGAFIQQLTPSASFPLSDLSGVVVQADGSVRAGGYARDASDREVFTTLGLTNAGILDPSWGGGSGIVEQAPTAGQPNESVAIAPSPGGKLVVAGFTGGNDSGTTSQLTIQRYTAAGTLDPSFNGTGTYELPIPASGTPIPTAAEDVAVDAAGRVTAVGTYGTTEALALRLKADGTLDTGFASPTGYVHQQFGAAGDSSRATAVALAPNGKIVVAGNFSHSASPGSGTFTGVVWRLGSDGTPDTTFGPAGTRNLTIATGGDHYTQPGDVGVQGDGKIVVAGDESYATGPSGFDSDIFAGFISRLNTDGTPDTTFGTGGTTILNAGSPGVSTYLADTSFQALLIDPAGRIIVTGEAGNSNGDHENGQVLLARFTAAGALDPAFGTTAPGYTVSPFSPANDGSGSHDLDSSGEDLALSSTHRILVSGIAGDANGNGRALVARYYEVPSPTAAFTFTPAAPAVAQVVTFDGSSSAPAESPIATYSWDLNGDGSFGDATGPTASTTFATAGSHAVSLRVTDNDGLSATTTHVIIASLGAIIPPKLIPPKLKLNLGKLTAAADGSVRIALRCLPPGPCKGTLTLTIPRSSARATKKPKTLTIGSASFTISGGKVKSVKVKLTKTGRSALKRHKRLKVTLTTTLKPAGQSAVTQHGSLTIAARAAKKK